MPRRVVRHPDAILFGEGVRRLRVERGWSREELAERAEMNAAYVGFIERGDNLPSLSVILQLGRALGVDPRRLLDAVVE